MARVQPILSWLDILQQEQKFEMTDGVSILEYWAKEVKEAQELLDGSSKFYHRGYRFQARLIFNATTQAQANGLRVGYNQGIELTFTPDPQEHPGITFKVRWINEWNFVYAYATRTDRYKGMIELEGTEILTSIPDWITIL